MDTGGVKIVTAMMGRFWARYTGDPTDYHAFLMRGVPRGVPSFPIYFIVYVNLLATKLERRAADRSTGNGAAIFLVDDIFVQSSAQQKLQELLDVATWWRIGRGRMVGEEVVLSTASGGQRE